jgi:hypothetical protein
MLENENNSVENIGPGKYEVKSAFDFSEKKVINT